MASIELGRISSASTQNRQKESDRPYSAQSAASVTGSVAITDYTRESEGHMPSKQSSRPVSAQSSTTKRSNKSNVSNHSGRGSKQNSRPTSADSHAGNSLLDPSPDHALSSHDGNQSLNISKKNMDDDEVSTKISQNGQLNNTSIQSGQGSKSRGTTPKSSESRGSRSNSSSRRSNSKLDSSSTAGSHRSWGSKAEIKADQVRQDLHKCVRQLACAFDNLSCGNSMNALKH